MKRSRVELMMAAMTLAVLMTAGMMVGAQEPAPTNGNGAAAQQATPQFQRQRPMRAANMAGKLGQVTEAASDHFVIKTSAGEVYRIVVTPNTRIVGGPNHVRTPEPAPAEGGPSRTPQGGMAPSTIPPSDIAVGDYITSVGELDASSPNTINASMIAKLDAERVKDMKAREADFGKTYLSGKIVKIEGTKITLHGSVDGVDHTIVVDENTSFTQRRDAATLADFHEGDMIRVDGTGTPGSDFHATKVGTMGGRMRGPEGGQRMQGGPQNQNGPAGTPQTSPMTTPVPDPAAAPQK